MPYQQGPKFKRHLPVLLLAAAALFITTALVRYPQAAFEASLHGINIWWNIVFPALLPFFIVSQLLMGLGVVHMMGVLLEPIMRPLFNVPGAGSFVMAMGLASGFPIGAILTNSLRQKGLLNKYEAERLLSFTNTADPLFMFGAVAVGMFGLPAAGITIAVAHYLSSISVGMVMRFYGRDPHPTPEMERGGGSILRRSIVALLKARQNDGRPLGELMGDAIRKSVNTLMLIGGFIILFSVLIRLMEVVGFIGIIAGPLYALIAPLGLHHGIVPALINGFFEIDLGCQMAATGAGSAPLAQQLMAASAIIAWSGLSVHAQVASIVSSTDISIRPYLWARILHALLAAIYTLILFNPTFAALHNIALPVFFYSPPRSTLSFWVLRTGHLLYLTLFVIFISIFIAIAGRTARKLAARQRR